MSRPLVLAMWSLALATAPARAEDTAPVLVELFTSEGCSSCPPADLLLGRLLAENPKGMRLIALGEHVDYWDDLGWRDRFSSSLFTSRQEAYAKTTRSAVFTPQLVVNGRTSVLGSDAAAVRAAISSSRGLRSIRVEPQPLASGGGVDVQFAATWAQGVAGEVYVALVQDRATSRVASGENAGRTLTHVAVARSLVKAGTGAGAYSGQVHFPMAQSSGADRLVVFVQEPGGGPVHAAGTASLQ
jgi:hypothetical protein